MALTIPQAPRITGDQIIADPALFAYAALGITPHPTQAAFLRDRHPVKVAACGRRWGKSTAAAMDAIHLAIVGDKDGQPTQQIIFAPTSKQTTIICDEIERLLRKGPLETQQTVANITHHPYAAIEFTNGSLIEAFTVGDKGVNIRGFGVHRAIVDEAAFVPERVIQESILPMLADHYGQLVLISTPFGRNVFWEYFVRGGSGDPDRASAQCRSFQFPSTLNPHISSQYIADQRPTMTANQWKAEWLAEFLDDQSTVFKWALIERATSGQFREPLYQHQYAVGWDPSKYHDKSAVVVLDITSSPAPVVHIENIEGRDFTQQLRVVADVARRYHDATVLMDCTSNAKLLEDLHAVCHNAAGLTFTNASKNEIIDGLVTALEHQQVTFPAEADQLITELRYYEYKLTAAGNVKLGAPDRANAYDDFVTALALAVHAGLARQLAPLDDDLVALLADYRG